jgi:tetratricopeptide (TPR) repeat protein
MAAWRDVCGQAEKACKSANKQAAVEFASHLLPLFAAARAKPPASEAAVRSGTQSVTIVKQWLSQRAVMGRAQTTNAFLRLLARAGKIDDARSVLKEELEWVALNFTSPAKPVAAGALEKRLMSSTTRRALYLLLLAQGDIELAAGNFQESAGGFGSAVAIYEGQVEDHSDISRLLRAKFNQANSLLRLHRVKEAINIYELCRHGFNSIDDSEAAQRVEHAIVFAKSMGVDEDES